MPRLPRVPIDTQSARAEDPGAPAALGPPPSPSAYREKNPSELPPVDYKAPSMLAEHRGLALLFLAAIIAFALYCWKAPHRSVALDAPTQAAGAAGGEAARTRSPETSQSPVYVESLPDKER